MGGTWASIGLVVVFVLIGGVFAAAEIACKAAKDRGRDRVELYEDSDQSIVRRYTDVTLVGTLRYMAPERFRGECDTRADIYALGLTLYELLVLRPAFDGKDRLHLVEQIGRQEPARPRALDPRIPRDLETILMKAIEKEPRRRYASADALAADVTRPDARR